MMAGRVPHNSIFQYRHFDARALKLIAKAVNRKADTLLGAVTAELEREGIEVLDSSLFLKSLMPPPGLLTGDRQPTEGEQDDIDFGWPIAKAVAGQDIGQSIVVKGRAVIAVEAMEGTDECIRRAGEVAGPGCIVIKVSKPAQDLRFDIPVIGKTTLKHMVEAGCTALAFSARESLLFDQDEVLRVASENNISILARE
jgi:UDP-2,3-diacylglucosamine hydrolase